MLCTSNVTNIMMTCSRTVCVCVDVCLSVCPLCMYLCACVCQVWQSGVIVIFKIDVCQTIGQNGQLLKINELHD